VESGEHAGEGGSLSTLMTLWKPDKCHSSWCRSLIFSGQIAQVH